MTMHVHDLKKVADFWGALGLEREDATDESVSFTLPGSAPLTLHAWSSQCATNGGRPPGTVSGLMLATRDTKAACDAVKMAGGAIVAPPFPGPGGGRWAVAADPDGNEFMLCEQGAQG